MIKEFSSMVSEFHYYVSSPGGAPGPGRRPARG